ncbi:MAG TPA: 3-deoxy-D-manno-octulosonate 8-phosphate phosphatase [Phaeodactylibacter sp.]|nr:3-deoxy-D-manno-octulosonate 8-phosphate phosphatase [Phaeodactylibacter sp.]
MNFLEQLRDIDTFVFDVDGVFTNNQLLVTESGDLLRSMNARDGFAVKHALRAGYKVVIITGGNSRGVSIRLRNLGISELYTGISDKKTVLSGYLQQSNTDSASVLYMGDDLLDYHAMRLCGIPACPNDAAHEIIELAQYVSPYNGGEGCVRDVIEKVMRLHNRWLDDVQAADEQRLKQGLSS